MAFNINVPYFGTVQDQIFYDAHAETISVSKNLVTLLTNIVGRTRLPIMSQTGKMKAYNCTFTPTGDFNLDDRVLNVKDFSYMNEYCINDLKLIYDNLNSWKTVPGAFNGNVPTVESFVQAEIVRDINQTIDPLIWKSSDAYPDNTDALTLMDGFLTLFRADSNVTKVPSPTTLTTSNILTEFRKMVALQNQKVLASPNLEQQLYVTVSPATYQILTFALTSQGATSTYYPIERRGEDIYVEGYRIVKNFGIPDNEMVFAYTENLYVGVDLYSDFTQLRVVDKRDTTNDDKITIRANYRIGVQYLFPKNIVYYMQP